MRLMDADISIHIIPRRPEGWRIHLSQEEVSAAHIADSITGCIVYLVDSLNPRSTDLFNLIFSHLKLWLATAIHNFKWLEICIICEI